MPGDGERPEDAENFDPLEQPPLVRRPPQPLNEEPAGQASEEPEPPVSSPAKPRGRFLGFLGLLAGLAGLGLAGYVYYLLIYQDPQAPLSSRIAAIESELGSRDRALEALERSQNRALEDLAAAQARAREESAERVLDAVNRMAAQAPPSRREWKVAEVAYLLRIANHRVLMERDAAGALVLLKAADAILAELDDFALYQVRAQLADEIVALENVESNDVQGLFLRLEAIKTEIGRQTVKLPRFEAEEAAPAADAEAEFWAALWDQLGGYLRFRRFADASLKPLLAPEEAVYLELNLRLMLERAQLAALRREQVVFEQSLQTAADWMATYLDTEDASVRRSLDELEALSAVVLDRPLPDISGSLATLKSLGEA